MTTRTFGTVTGITNQPTGLDVGIGASSNIKSIQRGNSVFVNGTTTANTITISAVNLTKSIILFSVVLTSTATQVNGATFEADFLSSTSFEITRQFSVGGATVYWQVIEFNNVKSLQNGNTASTTVTISAVNTAKSIVFSSIITNSALTTLYLVPSACELTNATTISFFDSAAGPQRYWQVVEFN